MLEKQGPPPGRAVGASLHHGKKHDAFLENRQRATARLFTTEQQNNYLQSGSWCCGSETLGRRSTLSLSFNHWRLPPDVNSTAPLVIVPVMRQVRPPSSTLKSR